MKKGQRTTASPEQITTVSFWPMNEPHQEKTVLQRLHEASINPGIVRGEVTEWSHPNDPNDPDIRRLFKVRGKTFDSQEAAAEWAADQERINATELFLRRSGAGRLDHLMRLIAVHEIGALISKHPQVLAQALEIRCEPEAFAAFADELMLLRNGGI
jgi:hypothetical protein